MAIQPLCDMCGNELLQFGALLFGPPNSDNKVKKFHICIDCYTKMLPNLKKTTRS